MFNKASATGKSPLNRPFKSPFVNRSKTFTSPCLSSLAKSYSGTEESNEEINSLLRERDKLKADIKNMNDRLSKLDRIRVYKEKLKTAEFGDINELISKWRKASQEIIPILLTRFKLRNPNATVVQLLTAWTIPITLVRYDEDSEEFY